MWPFVIMQIMSHDNKDINKKYDKQEFAKMNIRLCGYSEK